MWRPERVQSESAVKLRALPWCLPLETELAPEKKPPQAELTRKTYPPGSGLERAASGRVGPVVLERSWLAKAIWLPAQSLSSGRNFLVLEQELPPERLLQPGMRWLVWPACARQPVRGRRRHDRA